MSQREILINNFNRVLIAIKLEDANSSCGKRAAI